LLLKEADEIALAEPSLTRKLSDVTVSCGEIVIDAEAFLTPTVAIVPVAVIKTVKRNSFSAVAVAEEVAEIVAEASTITSAAAELVDVADTLADPSRTFKPLAVTFAVEDIAETPATVLKATEAKDALAVT
jgi:hypothetical protein